MSLVGLNDKFFLKKPNLATNFLNNNPSTSSFLQTSPHKLPTQCEKELQFIIYMSLGGERERQGVSSTLKSSELKKQQYGIVEHVQLTRTKSTLHFFLSDESMYSIYVLDS